MAGTRPRGRQGKKTGNWKPDFLKDEKERAEHNVLVDLGRNDIGKISKIGSVKVEKYVCVEHFSACHASWFYGIGDLREDKDAVDAVDAILPAGTLSGAPKFRPVRSSKNWNTANVASTVGQSVILILQEIWIPVSRSAWFIKKKGEICIRSRCRHRGGQRTGERI